MMQRAQRLSFVLRRNSAEAVKLALSKPLPTVLSRAAPSGKSEPAPLTGFTFEGRVIANGIQDDGAATCRACGACCSFSPEWPRFSLETDAEIELIPHALIDDEHGRMRCKGNRCAALVGDVGVLT